MSTTESIQDQLDGIKLSRENTTRQIDMIVLMMRNNIEDKLDNAAKQISSKRQITKDKQINKYNTTK